jgi:hypothetical protein
VDHTTNEFRIEEFIERIKIDPVIAHLAMVLNEVITEQLDQDRRNALVYSNFQKNSEQIKSLSESLSALSQAMVTYSCFIYSKILNRS